MANSVKPVNNPLAVMNRAHRKLEQSQSLDGIKQVRDTAEAVRVYVQSARLGLELQNDAAELKLRAERKAGRLLASLKLRGGDRRSNSHHVSLKLDDLGISYNESARWQQEGSVPDDVFEQYLREARRHHHEVSTASLIRLARTLNRNRNPTTETRPERNNNSRSADCQTTTNQTGQPSVSDNVREMHQHLLTLLSIIERVCADDAVGISQIDRRCMLRYTTEVIVMMENYVSAAESQAIKHFR